MAARLGDEGLAGFNSRQMGGWIDRQMDGQPDIASAFEPGPRVAGPFWTSSGLCSRPCGRVGCPGAVPAIVPSLLPAPAARWLPATPNNCVLIGKGKKKKKNGALQQLPGETFMEEGDAKPAGKRG